ncbi:hypothetical protein GCM10028791_25110 [Echinicola sediminis]
MEIAFTFVFLTLVYGLSLLSFYPERYFRKLSYKYSHQHLPDYKKLRLSEPLFFSFLGGYILASVVIYFII